MRKGTLLIIVAIIFFVQIGFTQNKQVVDSLLKRIESGIPDQEKVDLYNRIAYQYISFDSTHTTLYANKAISIAKDIDYVQGEADALYEIGWVTKVFGHYEQACLLFSQVIEKSDRSNYKKGMADGYNGLADAFRQKGNYSVALDNYLISLKIREEIGDESRVAGSLNNIGIVYYSLQDYRKAQEYYQRAFKIRQALGDESQMAVSYLNLGIVALSTSNYEKALNYYIKSLEINSKLKDRAALAQNYYNLGVLYVDHLNDYDRGLDYYFKALNIYEELGFGAYKSYPLIGLGTAYTKKQLWSKARQNLTEALDLSSEAGFLSNVRDAASQLAIVEERTGNYKAAFEAASLFKTMSDSLSNEEQTKRLTRLEAEYVFQKEKDSIHFVNEKEKFVISQHLQQEKDIQYYAFSGVAFLLVVLFVLYRFYILKRQANDSLILLNEEVNTQKEQLEVLNLEKNKLIGMVAHDLRSPLNLVKGLVNITQIEKDEAEKERFMELITISTDRMTDMVNRILDVSALESKTLNLKMEKVDLVELINQLMINFQINAGKKKQKVELINNCDSAPVEIDKNYFIQVLENLVSNAIKYSEYATDINILLNQERGDFRITIQDHGQGISEEEQKKLFKEFSTLSSKTTGGEKATGLGLSIVKKYVEAMQGKIWCESELGVGSRFILQFGLVPADV